MGDFSEKYREFLKSHLVAGKNASGGKEVSGKCKYCPDGSDPRHGHMYISIPQNPGDISWFYCQKCKASGIVDNRRLIEWGMYDPEIATNLIKINDSARKLGNKKAFERQVYNLYNCIGSNIDLAKTKLSYINNRLGINLGLQEAINEKIIFNIADVLQVNNITKLTRYKNILEQLNQYFVGFLSLDNNFINLRRLCQENIVYESIDKRYVNYNIHDKQDNTEKFYVMPVNINASIPTRIQIHIAEGPFDILSIRHNLRKDPNAIYAAIGGSAYKGLVMHIINTLYLYFVEVHIYPDNDIHGRNRVMEDLSDYLKPYNIPLYVHRNIFPGQKDFGVSLEKITESIVKM